MAFSYEQHFQDALAAVRSEGRYRVFADLKRIRGRFPKALWTGPLGEVNSGQFINLPLSLAIPVNATGKALEFRTVQTYSNGQVVHWIEPALTAEHPSPRINVTAKGGAIEDIAGGEAGPAAGQTAGSPSAPASTPAARSTSSGASKGLGIAALLLGALGLLAGLSGLLAARRARTTH